MFGGAVVLAAQVAFVAPEIRGQGTCPSAADVAARLVPLLPWGEVDGKDRPDVGELASRGEERLVRLRDPEGRVAHEHVLEAGPSCAERATEAAALVASWEADLHADVAFPRAEPPAPSAPSLPSPASPPSAPASPPSAPAPAAPPARTVSAARAVAPSVAPSRPLEATIGAELFFAAPPDAGVTPAGSLEAILSRGGRWHGRAALAVTGTHAVALAPGTVSWRRGSFAVGTVVDATTTRARLSARADALVGAILSQGSGFSLDESATSWQGGVDVGLRLTLPVTPRLSLWADAAVAWFPGAQRLSVLNVSRTAELPSTEIDGGVGLSLSLFP